jgi:hypothetical protein
MFILEILIFQWRSQIFCLRHILKRFISHIYSATFLSLYSDHEREHVLNSFITGSCLVNLPLRNYKFYYHLQDSQIYRVSIKSFPDYKHLLQENYVEYKHFFFQYVTQLKKFFTTNLSNGKKCVFLTMHHSINLF